MTRLYFALALIASVGLNWWQFQHCNSAMARMAAEHEAQRATAAAQASEQARQAEAEKADLANQVAIEYERGKQDAQAVADRVADDLRAGALRLRKQWQGCEARVPEAATGPGEPDAGAADRAEGARRIVRAAAECDAQVKGLQALVKADRS
jgi:hypothetical protein